MTDIWERTHPLKGETLYTIAQRKPFDIIRILHDRIVFVPHDGNGTQRWASREQIETITHLVQSGKVINPKLVREQYPNDQNTSYIAAIVKAITTK